MKQASIVEIRLAEQYTQLWNGSIKKFRDNIFELDPLIDLESDTRYGITLLIRLHPTVTHRIQTFLRELQSIEPSQYYYLASDMHVTVMSIISCYPGFTLEQIQVQEYIAAITTCLEHITRFDLTFHGITASSSCVMLQGFPGNQILETSRDAIREYFRQSPLQHSIDTRYAIRTAHATVVRFRRTITQATQFINVLERYREYDFGTCEVDSYELVFNDWYQRAHHVQPLHTFLLRGRHGEESVVPVK